MSKRFEFGRNWELYSQNLESDQLRTAKNSLIELFGEQGLAGKSFLDIGCGSGIFSLAALDLGASQVLSFDFDVVCVETTIRNIESFYLLSNQQSKTLQGDILSSNFLDNLGQFDVVYSWGVLHHTGEMWSAIENAMSLVKPGGYFMIAIYNDQGIKSTIWKAIKWLYVSVPSSVRHVILIPCFIRLWLPTFLRDLINLQPYKTWKNYSKRRGMSPWTDVVDWVGGYPFEVATPNQLCSFVEKQDFELVKSKLVGNGLGCNEFLFEKTELNV